MLERNRIIARIREMDSASIWGAPLTGAEINAKRQELYEIRKPIEDRYSSWKFYLAFAGVLVGIFCLTVIVVGRDLMFDSNEIGVWASLWFLTAIGMFGSLVALEYFYRPAEICARIQEGLEWCDDDLCTHILKWLENEEIKRYRDSVVNLSRRFTTAEFEMMKNHFENEAQNAYKIKAFKDVYGDSLENKAGCSA
ncbi:MAG: hypothetical protein C9356_20300 [Oleiphilus sp.]|nr:MAG: hypothetical protein C9356_20300 [Oleiphilus sp.]